MSATSYDSDECSFSDDDSEFNFIPGRYWAIESEKAMDASESGDGEDGESESKDDGQTGIKPNSGETMADEEWLKQYKLRQSEKERRPESLKNRLSGNETLSNWCLSKDQAIALRLWIRLFRRLFSDINRCDYFFVILFFTFIHY